MSGDLVSALLARAKARAERVTTENQRSVLGRLGFGEVELVISDVSAARRLAIPEAQPSHSHPWRESSRIERSHQ
jgi:hypothetical protein